MTPAARLAAAAAIIDRISTGKAPAETVLKTWGTENRYAGSGDRRAIAEQVYKVVRARGRLVWAMGGREDGRALVIGALSLIDGLTLEQIEALHSGDGYGPKPLSKQERARLTAQTTTPTTDVADAPAEAQPDWVAAGLPEFVVEDFKNTFGTRWSEEASGLMVSRAPIDLRVNGAKATLKEVETELRQAGLSPQRTPWSAWGLRLPAEPAPNVQSLEAFKAGRIEVQDEGSQIVCWLAGVQPGMTVVDYCAGGGGKTLGLAVQGLAEGASRVEATPEPERVWTPTGWVDPPVAAKVKPAPLARAEGRLIACDVVQKRLDNIMPRLARAGVEAELIHLGPNGGGVEDIVGTADVVFVDAPCTGSGTWRRRPEDAWRLKPEEVDRMHSLQMAILARAAKLVKPGGRLVYVTCSMLRVENEATVDHFEEDHPSFAPVQIADALNTAAITDAGRARLVGLAQGHRLRMSPATTETDGFFVAIYERQA